MTQEEIKIGQEWLGILAKYQSDFTTKSLFNSTTSFLNNKSKGVKKFTLSQDSGKLATPSSKVEKLEEISLLEAAKKRMEFEEEPTNLLATSEDDLSIPKTKRRNKKNV